MAISKYSRRSRRTTKKSAPKKRVVRKKTPKAKTINRKTNKNRQLINGIVRNQKLVDKMLFTKMTNTYLGYQSINESFDVNSNAPGANQLVYDDNIANVLPCHMYSLTSFPNANVPTAKARLDLKSDLASFQAITGNSDYDDKGNTGFLAQPTINDREYRYLINRYNNIKLVLFGRESFKTVYDIKLIKLLDSELDPFDGNADSIVPTDSDIIATRQAFYGSLIKTQVTNPISGSRHHLGAFNGKFKIVWEKKYIVPEKSADYDQMPHRIVKIFRQDDKLCDFQSESKLVGVPFGIGDPQNIPEISETQSGIREVPKQGQRLYLMISANASRSNAEGATTADWPTYDINIMNKWSYIGTA